MIISSRTLTTLFAAFTLRANGLAFDGAVGFGSIATGGTGGTTYTVTTLADSGTGSFRDAVSGSNRIINFSVGGYIELESAVSLSSSITINGQTAPGGGIAVMGAEVSGSGKSNIIIRNFRFRQGTLDSDTGKSAVNFGDATNIILDHCSVEFGQWDSIDAVGVVNLTVSNSIIALPIGQQFGAHVETGPSTFYRNLWVSAHNRQPLSKDNTQYLNNVVYNYQAAYTSANTGGYFSHDIIGNYFITGPSTTSASDAFYQMDSYQSVYSTGNYLDSNKDGTLNGAAYNTVGSAVVLSSPWYPTSAGLASLSAADAYAYVIANAGASPRDELDTYVVGLVETLGTGGALIKNQDDTGLSNGGYGTITG
ncbi:polysaccharide lyase family 1 protein [Xylariales sp. PMI_506]|nr:polysaccharide lyase family 1 protein [Xylariales sp. PMI_506]